VRRIQGLWLPAVVGGSTTVEPAQVRPSSAAHLVETSENPHALELEDDDVSPVDVAIHRRDPTARRRRADMKQTLSSSEPSLAQVLDLAETDDAIALTKIIDVLNALPRVGDVRATKVMERLDIPFDRRLGQLGKHQIAALLAEFCDTYAANEPKSTSPSPAYAGSGPRSFKKSRPSVASPGFCSARMQRSPTSVTAL
jgi:hypothetical protein